MEWEGRQESQNVEDRRGMGVGRGTMAVGGVGGIIIVVVGLLFGVDLRELVDVHGPGGGPGGQPGQQEGPRQTNAQEERQAAFTKVIFHDTEVIWEEQFAKLGKKYEKPILVLFSGRVDSACGQADAAVGPFYCPGDSRVFIDLSFYNDMQRKLNAPGEFARAYVIAHEVGHHVQRLLGYSRAVDEVRARGNKVETNRASVRLELQADYLAGVWAHHGQRKFNFLQDGDIDTALKAAFEIGDDRLQKRSTGTVVPDSFTHGTSKQRMRWFNQGFKTGDVKGAKALFDLPYDQL